LTRLRHTERRQHLGHPHGRPGHDPTSATCTGRRSRRDSSHASATRNAASASATGHGESTRAAATSRKAASSRTYAGRNRSRKFGYAGPAGKLTPGSAERSGSRSSKPTAMLSADPNSSNRTSYPAGLYRLPDTVASVPSSRVSSAAPASTSPAAAKNAAP